MPAPTSPVFIDNAPPASPKTAVERSPSKTTASAESAAPPPSAAPATTPAPAESPAASVVTAVPVDVDGVASPASSTLTALEMPPPTPMKTRRRGRRKRKPSSFIPSALTSGITQEMRDTKTSEEFENDVESATVKQMMQNARAVIPSLSDISLAFNSATKSVSDLSTAASSAASKASKSVSDLSLVASGAAKTASEHAFSFGAAISDVSQKVATGAKAAMDTAAAAKLRTSDAYTAASVQVSAASKSLSETTTALMEQASAAKAKITEVSKTVSDAAINLSTSAGSSDPNVTKSSSSAEAIKDTIKAATSSAASTAISKFSTLSRSLSSIFSAGSTPGRDALTPRKEAQERQKNAEEFVALADLCPMPAIAYKPSNHSPPTSEGGGESPMPESQHKLVNEGEKTYLHNCIPERAFQQSSGTNSFESVVLIRDHEVILGPIVRHPTFNRVKEVRPKRIVGNGQQSKKIEEWALQKMERAEVMPDNALPQTRLGEREHWLLNTVAAQLQKTFSNMKRHDFTIHFTRGFEHGLPFLEVELTPI